MIKMVSVKDVSFQEKFITLLCNINEVREKDVYTTFSKSFSWTDSLNAAFISSCKCVKLKWQHKN